MSIPYDRNGNVQYQKVAWDMLSLDELNYLRVKLESDRNFSHQHIEKFYESQLKKIDYALLIVAKTKVAVK